MNELDSIKYKISVIVPCYNTENYLCKCVDSILKQTYRNIELILVDDGSNDRTGSICDAYANKDNRVIVIHKDNGGASSARNAGIKAATGDFLAFADSDDWMVKQTYQYLMYLIVKHNADCAIGRTDGVYEKNGRFYFKKTTRWPDKTIDSTEAIRGMLQYGCGVVNKLIKRDFFEDIEFEEGVINEDELIMLKLYLKMQSIVVAGRQTYFYRFRTDSVTKSVFSLHNLDFYYNTQKNIEIIRKQKPELLEYALARHYKAAAYCAAKLFYNLKGPKGDLHREIIKKDLKQNRKSIINCKHLTLPYKIIGLVCSYI